MHATVSHFEIPARDLVRAARFYREVFGWQVEPLRWEGHPYFTIRGASGETSPSGKEGIDGGILPIQIGEKAGADHPLLVIHIAGASLDDCLQRVVAAGGWLDQPPRPVGAFGFFARFRDSEGNLMGLWQAAP
ncbi:MAG: uncharacterized protein QOF89_127 [Acidobacteriota bacterium]|jgi:predicted enzyme related to lactoylglutathione lyase|nr:uncharacterized protein [Acidobacteriota bacterium]